MNESQEKLIQFKKYGFVYFAVGGGYVKIGRTRDIGTREKFYQINMPFKCEFLHYIESDDHVKAEIYFHKLFAEKRINGEWFELNDSDIREIKKSKYVIFSTRLYLDFLDKTIFPDIEKSRDTDNKAEQKANMFLGKIEKPAGGSSPLEKIYNKRKQIQRAYNVI